MNALLPIVVLAGTALLSWPLGRYLKWAMDPEPGPHGGLRGRFERLLAGVAGGAGERSGAPLQGWKAYSVSLLAFNAVDVRLGLPGAGRAAPPAVEPRRQGGPRAEPDLQHRRLVRHQHQPPALLGRAVAVLSLAARRHRLAAVRLGGHRHRGAGGARPRTRRAARAGKLLRRPRARHLPRAPAAGARRSRRARPLRRADDLSTARRWRGPSKGRPRRSPAGRWRRWSPSSSSAPTAAATSAPTAPIRSRTPPSSPTCWRTSPSCSSRWRRCGWWAGSSAGCATRRWCGR